MFILWWIIVGLIAGWLTGKIMRGAGYGVIGDIIVGIIGALIGGFIAMQGEKQASDIRCQVSGGRR